MLASGLPVSFVMLVVFFPVFPLGLVGQLVCSMVSGSACQQMAHRWLWMAAEVIFTSA